jgi:hypothetical protein
MTTSAWAWQVPAHDREDLPLLVGDVVLERAAQRADRRTRLIERARCQAGGQCQAGPVDPGLDRLVIIGQRGQGDRLAGDGGDHRLPCLTNSPGSQPLRCW